MASIKELPVVSDDPQIQHEYVRLRMEGVSHNLADMFSHQKPPRADDDTTFLAARRPREQFAGTPYLGDFYAKEAKAKGMNISGCIYENGLARYPGDPDAWVSDRGEIRKKVEARGIGCEGAVNVKPNEDFAPPPSVDIADELVVARALQKMDETPGLQMSADLLEKSRNEAKPSWSKT
jgi:hypothetical protein